MSAAAGARRRRAVVKQSMCFFIEKRLLDLNLPPLILRRPAPISGLPEIGIMMRKSATADLRAGRLEGSKSMRPCPSFETRAFGALLRMRTEIMRSQSERPRILPAVDQQILPGDETGVNRAQEGHVGADLGGFAVAAGRIGGG